MSRCAIALFGLLGWAAVVAARPLPPEIVTEHLIGPNLAISDAPVVLRDQFYCLGWSKSGVIASLVHRWDSASSSSFVLEVKDLVEDRDLVFQRWKAEYADQSTEDWWSTHEAEMESRLLPFELLTQAQQLGEFPIIFQDSFYQVLLRSQPSPTDSQWLDRLQVVVNASEKGSKTVFEKEGYWRWGAILGFLPSPFENRVALLLLLQPAGWMNRLEPIRFRVVGMSLTVGFLKP